MDRRDRRVLVGRVVGVHGVRGGVKVESFTEPRGRIFDYQPWIVRQLGAERVARGRPLVRDQRIAAMIDGVEDRDAAAALLGAEICVRRAQLPAPAPGEYYWADLEGLAVVNLDGVPLGTVESLFATGANDVMVVVGARRYLIPFLYGSVVRTVDGDSRVITVEWDPEF